MRSEEAERIRADQRELAQSRACLTTVEDEIDECAREIMQRDSAINYLRAVSLALQCDPTLYDRYERHLSALKRATQGRNCGSCQNLLGDEDRFCAQCGSPRQN
jgi:hypothetical protein